MADQREIRIEAYDGKGIYGALSAGGNRRLVVHVHGLTHQAHYYLEVTSSEFFEENGFDHFSPSLYGRMPDSRKLPESTLSTHARDVQAILDHFKGRYDEIFVTAHSLGGLVMLMLNPPGVAAMSLWDPSTDVGHFWSVWPCLTHKPEQGVYHLDYGNVFVLGEAMVEEIKLYPDARCLELARQIATPTQFVIPSESIFLASPQTSPENYRGAFAGDFDLCRIPTANHVFAYRGNRQALFQATLDWFQKDRSSSSVPWG